MSSLTERWIAVLLGVPTTTLGESVLLHVLYPDLMATYEIWVLVGLLLFNFALATMLLFFSRDL